MPVDPFFVRRFPLIAGVGPPDAVAADPEEAARLAEYLSHPQPYRVPDLVDVTALDIPGPHGPVPARLYRRTEDRTSPEPRVPAVGVLWLHGGGFASGSMDSPEAHTVAAELARRAGAVVLSVGYRLAVDGVRHPVPLDDVVAAWEWFVASAHDLGVDPARAAVGGASAGANLAVAACLRVRGAGTGGGRGDGKTGTAGADADAGPAAGASARMPSTMLLAYPALHFPTPALPDDVVAEMRDVPAFHRFTDRWTAIVRGYVGRITDIPHEAMPGHAYLTGLPPALVVVGEHDDLRPSGELFARQLAECGGRATTYLAPGMLHGHLNREPTDELPEVDRTLDVLAAALG